MTDNLRFVLFLFFWTLLAKDISAEKLTRYKSDYEEEGFKEKSPYHRAFPVVEPDAAHTHLVLNEEGLEAISRIKNPVAVVSVIGPYRSGKSFLLNQLLSLTCSEGFGVGHMRDTKTKGIWVWGDPVEVLSEDGSTVSVLFVDTEGFESVGKSSVYDDRIFALAAIVSSVLIYNLPETVKEADIAKLSFAVQLADEFYGRVKGRGSTFEPASLLWLIQRDFLEGKSVEQMVRDALQPVSNQDGDRDVDEVNRIRDSLSLMAANGTAYGLPQPHLARTKLCELHDSELEPAYVAHRDELRKKVMAMVAPKKWGAKGTRLNGEQFADLLRNTLEALNKGKIPSAGSVVEAFNRGVLDRCLELYSAAMEGVKLPVPEEVLLQQHAVAAKAAVALFDQERFGHKQGSSEAVLPLDYVLAKALKRVQESNSHASSQRCEALYAACEDSLSYLENMRLPSMAKFDAGLRQCNGSVEAECLGPSKAYYAERLQKMWTRERANFLKEYNHRLFNWIVVFSLIMVVVGRFILKWTILEVAAWAMFIFLETYTRLFWSVEGLYFNPAWRLFVNVWEAIVFNPLIDLDRWAAPLLWVGLLSVIITRCNRFRRRPLLPVTSKNT